MKKVIFKITQILLTLFLSSVAIFLLLQATPTDPITLMINMPEDGPAVESQIKERKIEELKEKYHLDKSLKDQYLIWLQNILNGNLGKSIVTGLEVRDSIKSFLPNSILLALGGTFLEFVLALLAGIISASYVSKWPDHLMRFIGISLRSMPAFLVSIFFLIIFSTKLKIYEISNSSDISRLWLPVLISGLITYPKLSRIIRNTILDEMGKEYIVSYIAKGFPKRKIIKEALRNAMIPIFTSLSMNFASSIGGMVVIESIFTWPGIGNYGMASVLRQDYPAIQAYILIVTLFIIIINFATDLIYPLINPVIRRRD